MNTERNPSRYRELSEPFESPDEAEEAIKKFGEAVKAARIECGIPDVYCVIQVNITYPAGEGVAQSSIHLGSGTNALPLAAFAYGREKAEYEAAIASIVRGLKEPAR